MRDPDPLTADDMLQMLESCEPDSAFADVEKAVEELAQDPAAMDCLFSSVDPTVLEKAVEELAQVPAAIKSLFANVDFTVLENAVVAQDRRIDSWSQDDARVVRHDSPLRSRSRSRSPERSRSPQRWGKCSNVVDWDSDGEDVLCGEDCSPNEQVCHRCRRGLY